MRISSSVLLDRARSVRFVDATVFLPNSPFAGPSGLSPAASFRRGPRVAGARFWDLDAVSEPAVAPHNLPSDDHFATALHKLGLKKSDEIVCYDQMGTFSSPRLWFTLKYFGLENVSVLDGGLPAWIAAGGETEDGTLEEEHEASDTDYVVSKQQQLVAWNLGDVEEWLSSSEERPPLLDARPTGRFLGTAPEPRPGVRSGHAPGATSLPFTEMLQPSALADAALPGGAWRGAQLKEAPELRGIFGDIEVDVREPVALTCGSGLTAAVLALALNELETPKICLYDGSWLDYEKSGLEVVSQEEK